MDADWQAVSGSCNGDGKAGETGEIEPLRVAHGFAITRAGTPIAFAMAESGRGANWGQKNGDVFHCFEDAGALEIASRGFCDEFEHRGRCFRARGFQIIQKNWAELRFFSRDLLHEELCDDWTEEKPPEIESAVEIVEPEWLDAETCLFEKSCRAIHSGERFGCRPSDG